MYVFLSIPLVSCDHLLYSTLLFFCLSLSFLSLSPIPFSLCDFSFSAPSPSIPVSHRLVCRFVPVFQPGLTWDYIDDEFGQVALQVNVSDLYGPIR